MSITKHGDAIGWTDQTEHEKARTGSQMLLEALNKHFWRWEVQHGFRRGAGAILVPNGYDPTNPRAVA